MNSINVVVLNPSFMLPFMGTTLLCLVLACTHGCVFAGRHAFCRCGCREVIKTAAAVHRDRHARRNEE